MVSQHCCFVLWGEHCDEASAVLFVTILRAAGLRVWLVGISGKRISGGHGLQLVADLALDQALPLAPQAAVVIVPCPAETLSRFLYDPRLRTFLEITTSQATPLLLAPSSARTEQSQLLLDLALPTDVITIYPTGEGLHPFIHTLATKLT